MSTSALGSVKGKNDGRSRSPTSAPKKRFTKYSSVAFEVRHQMFFIDAQPFNLLKHRRVRRIVVFADRPCPAR